MSNSPIIVPSENQIELSDGIPNDGESILIDDTTDADDVNIPLLSKTDVLTGSKSSHIDENTENEAVGSNVTLKKGNRIKFIYESGEFKRAYLSARVMFSHMPFCCSRY